MIRPGIISILTVLGVTLSGCYSTEKTMGVAYLRPIKTDSLEIEIPYIVKGRGSVHNFTFEKFTDTSANWIYISSIQQSIPSERLTLVYNKGYRPQSNLHGSISIYDSSLVVDFKIPHYNRKGAITRWTNYNFNGVYKLSTIR